MSSKPLANNLVVQRLDDEQRVTPGGIVIPDSAVQRAVKSRVLAVGPGRVVASDGKIVEIPLDPRLQPGAIVEHQPGAGVEIDPSRGLWYLADTNVWGVDDEPPWQN